VRKLAEKFFEKVFKRWAIVLAFFDAFAISLAKAEYGFELQFNAPLPKIILSNQGVYRKEQRAQNHQRTPSLE
jgi:hypothetical protein